MKVPVGTPKKFVTARSASVVLDRAFAILMSECAKGDERKLAIFDALKGTLMGEGGASYAQVAERLCMSEGAVKVAAHRLRKRLVELVREELAVGVEH